MKGQPPFYTCKIHKVGCVKLKTLNERLLGGNLVLFNFMFIAFSLGILVVIVCIENGVDQASLEAVDGNT